MQTAWMGVGVPQPFAGTQPLSSSLAATALPSKALPLTLSDTPGVPTTVTLPDATQLVRLWTSTDVVWFAFDEAPGPIPPPILGSTIPAAAFRTGDILMPGGWQETLVPAPTQSHTLQLVSQGVNPTVHLVVYGEFA